MVKSLMFGCEAMLTVVDEFVAFDEMLEMHVIFDGY